jgi:hypothetical protein
VGRKEQAIRYLIDDAFAGFEHVGASCPLNQYGETILFRFEEDRWRVDVLISEHVLNQVFSLAALGDHYARHVRHAFGRAGVPVRG